jgi:excisionase family DNA binding protein
MAGLALAPPPSPALLTLNGACAYLGCSRRTIERLIGSGALPAVRLGERLTRVDVRDLDAFIASRRSTEAPGRPTQFAGSSE